MAEENISDTVVPSRHKWLDYSLIVLVVSTALVCGMGLLGRFLSRPRLLWSNVIHDRNAHLLSGMNLATHVQQGAWSRFFADLDSFRTWPILHDGICVGLSLGLGHNDERWAILPSLIAWMGSAVFAYLLVRKSAVRGGRIGGLVAALFILVSPAHRAYATDVMLESLGAFLTLACLYAYVVARQSDLSNDYRNLAIALTLLFLEKYNYWTLVIIGLMLDQITSYPSGYLLRLKECFQTSGKRGWLTRQFRQPLNYLLCILIILLCAIILIPLNVVTLFGHPILLQPPANLVSIIYIVLLMRMAPWYQHTGRQWIAQSSPKFRAILTWHIWPIALWFLWPHHLYSFLWVNSPAANGGEYPRHDMLGGYAFYGNSFLHDYHISVWSVVLAISLFLVGCVAAVRSQLRPGTAAIFWLVIIACFLTVHHPNRKSRFLHTWIPVLWVGASIGAASVMPARSNKRFGVAVICYLGGAGICLLALSPGLMDEAHAPEGGISVIPFSGLDITDAYLPDLVDSRNIAVFANMPLKHFVQWTYLKRYASRTGQNKLETDVKGFNPLSSNNNACFEKWLLRTHCDTIVYLNFEPGTIFYQAAPDGVNLSQYGDMLRKQTIFKTAVQHLLPRYGCTVTVWKRSDPIRLNVKANR